jgi:prefoldin subunit 5
MRHLSKVRAIVATLREDLKQDEGKMFVLFVIGLSLYVYAGGGY